MQTLHLEHDLFLLLLHLSQVTGGERTRNLFLDSINSLSEHLCLRFIEKPDEATGELIEIATSQNSFGFIDLQSMPDHIDESIKALVRNSVRMLALFLEKQFHDKLLSDEKMLLTDLVAKQTQRLEVANKELRQEIVARKQAVEALQVTNERHSSMIANIGDVIGIIGVDGLMRYKSPNIERWFGWKPEDLVGTDGWRTVHLEDIERIQKEFYALLEKENASTTVEYRYKCKDATYKWIELVAINCINNTAINGVLLNYHDISDRKQAEEQLRQAQKMESVGRLAGGVAHDFNNMLGVILGHAEMIMEQMDSSQPFFNNLQEIHTAAQRSADLTRQLLAFARKQTISPKVLDLNKTVESMLMMLRRLIGEDIDLAWLPGKKLWRINIDPSQVDQILANLCVNARDAISDTGKLTIETGTIVFDEIYCAQHQGFKPGEYVLLALSDNGCGMDTDTQNNIFEPFFTTKELGKGTGLGLATVYGIVKQNNGFINIYSEPDQGTTFKIYLPRHMGKTDQTREKKLVEPSAHGNETILLVEDEPAILNLTTMMLQRLGYTVLASSTPGETIRLAREHSGEIELLITDVVMPEMNGRDLAKKLLSLYPNLKRLFMSGYTANVIAHHGVLDEGVHFIQKPFSKKDLATIVKKVLEE